MKCDRRSFEAFAAANGWAFAKTESSHASWRKPGARRPVIIDTNYKDMPEKLITSNLKTMEMTRRQLREFLDKYKG